MKLTQFCLDRPIFAIVINLIVIILGVLSFNYLTVRYQPKIFMPQVYIITNYSGASAAVIDQTITQKIEKHLQGTENLDTMSSSSVAGASFIELDFKQISPADFLRIQSDITSNINKLRLPLQAQKPKIRFKGQGNMLMAISFRSKHLSTRMIGDYVQQNILPELQQIPGVGDIRLNGPHSAVRIDIDPTKLVQYNLTINDVVTRLQSYTENPGLGSIITNKQMISIKLNSIKHIAQFNNLVIAQQSGRLIKLKQIAHVFIGDENYTQPHNVSVDGYPGVLLVISAADDANPIAIGHKVRAELAKLKPQMPSDLVVSINVDRSVLFNQSLQEVYKTIGEAILLVCLITLFFLGSFKFTLIPAVTIPVCLIGGCICMLLFGFSLNIMTLLAIVLAVGLVVDDAIVVLENVHRHLDEGEPAKLAAKTGSMEVSFAIVGMTICLLAVYVPIGLMQGETAVYFRTFAFTLAGCVLISGFTALTLTPVMCQFLLRKHSTHAHHTKQPRFTQLINNFFNGLQSSYSHLLSQVIAQRYLMLLLFIILIVAGVFIFKQLPSTFMPKDQSGLIIMRTSGLNTQSFSSLSQANKKLMRKISKLPGIENYVTFAGDSNGHLSNTNFFSLTPALLDNTKQANKLTKQINILLKQQINLTGSAHLIPMMGHFSMNNPSSIGINLAGNVSYPALYSAGIRLAKALSKEPSVQGDPPDASTVPAITFDINWDQAAKLNIDPSALIQTVSTAFNGTQLTNEFEYGGNTYPITVELPLSLLNSTRTLKKIYINSFSPQPAYYNNQQNMIPLSRVIKAKNSIDFPLYLRINSTRTIMMSYNPAPNYTLGQATEIIQKTAQAILPANIHLAFMGDAANLAKSRNEMLIIFVLGASFIYLVLAALFESFTDPLIILLTVPLCIIGALAALWLIKGSINLYTTIGLVTLIGLVSKHGVLITQFANELILQGLSKRDAVIKAATIRLRPILMTSLTMILGALPLILQHGAGSNSRGQLGWVIVSGLVIGSLFSLFIVPVAYDFLSRKKLEIRKEIA